MTTRTRRFKLSMPWKIVIGAMLGIIWGIYSSKYGYQQFTSDWIAPLGNVFMKLLKLIAIPLVLTSLIDGIAGLQNVSGLSRMGWKTVLLYMGVTVIAIGIGLALVNLIEPGKYVSEEKRVEMQERYGESVSEKIVVAESEGKSGPLSILENMVPDNLFGALGNNELMLQVIVFSLLFGIAILSMPSEKTLSVRTFIKSLNDIILRMVDLIMRIAPIGVFALLASMNADVGMLGALLVYCLTVLAGIFLMLLVVYPGMLLLMSRQNPIKFYKEMLPVQLLAFSTSSSAASLPANFEVCEKKLGLREETTGLVLPLGATVNMDGTSLYQAVAAVFIAQVYGTDLGLVEQLSIILTATLASIGAAPVPGAGMVMLVIILQSLGINPEGLALIIGVDRVLDMFRTVANITSDATVAVIVDHSEFKDAPRQPASGS